MESKNDAPRVIIQLILSAAIYYIFTFKFKDVLTETLSLQVYYQVLVISVIINSYISKWIDTFRLFICHKWMMFFSKRYKAKHYKSQTETLYEKSKLSQLSDEAKNMVAEMSETDIELETEISLIHKEIYKFKQGK
ncbi:hypothetical protein [Serratia fonticola]|uniref:hypothetical protein n=1 Tax=Serratia fonticola TaxID=47917 RepID=UPI0021794160|nr:hypothetical protein [Serratia fonticola]CAI0833460.1 Uncharacterised protein [Serratia fonticola]CAI0956713.1 Uncharacterised protein [Serratia fonticola]